MDGQIKFSKKKTFVLPLRTHPSSFGCSADGTVFAIAVAAIVAVSIVSVSRRRGGGVRQGRSLPQWPSSSSNAPRHSPPFISVCNLAAGFLASLVARDGDGEDRDLVWSQVIGFHP